MHIRFLGGGTGSARAAADYLVGERDSAGRVRPGVEVLRGNPDQVAAVADSLAFERTHSSAVISWAPGDRPTDAQIGAVLDEFEKTTWAGLEPDRYAWTAVLHREHGDGVHVHVLTARCDLETGRSLNVAPPGWQKTFDALRDAFNHQHGWARPDDPARAKPQQPGHRAYIEAARLRAGIEVEPGPRELIRDYLLQRVESGLVQSRADVVAALEEAGLEVPRQGKDYLTARDPENGKRSRLNGALYEQDFEPERLQRPAADPDGERAPADRGDGDERAAAAWREFARRRERRAAYHRNRYGGGGRTDARDSAERVLRPLVVGLLIFFGISGGSWGLMQWLSASIQSRIETLATLDVQIEDASETLAEIEEATWGVTLLATDRGRFVVLSEGTLDHPPWTVAGRPALKLPSE